MSKVFVVQNQHRWSREEQGFVPKYDISIAEEHGPLIPILSPTAAPFCVDKVLPDIQRVLKNFTDQDFLLLIGNPVLIGLCTAVAAQATGGNLKLLQWSGKDGRYIVVKATNLFD